jgi:hypothetical protein
MLTANLEYMMAEIFRLKAAEAEAKNRRYELEAELVKAIGHKDEGTVKAEQGAYQATITYKLDRKVDGEAVRDAWDSLPDEVQDAFTWKPDLSIRQYRALETANPKSFSILAKFITTKPAKPTIKIEEIE